MGTSDGVIFGASDGATIVASYGLCWVALWGNIWQVALLDTTLVAKASIGSDFITQDITMAGAFGGVCSGSSGAMNRYAL
jgi:hypothetical protein